MDVPAWRLIEWRERPGQMVEELFGVKPDAWQQKALDAFPNSKRIALKAPIDVEAVVPTPGGVRRWGDIQPGDELFAENGLRTKVLRRFNAGIVPLFRVTFRDGTSLRVSGDHEWDIQTQYDRKSGARQTVSTVSLIGKVKRGVQRLVSIPSQGPAQFPHADLPADPYIFGLWLGDGIANEPRLICPDMAIRAAIRARGQEITESDAVTKRIGLSGWIKDLRATGMMACRSYEKFIPAIYRTASVDQRLDLLRGLMDSDGTVAKNGHTYLASSSRMLINDFLGLARSLGYVAKMMGPYIINDGENRDSYRAVICGKLCPFLAETPKKARWRLPIYGKTIRFIDSIEPDGHGEAMCVEIDHPSHCFQASDYITTHNCKGPGKTATLAWLGWNFLLTRPNPMVGATSISSPNLKANLWSEMARWRNAKDAGILRNQFEYTRTEIYHREYRATWRMEARSWAQDADATQIGNALAGLHADYVMWLLDESGDYPDALMPTAEGIFSGAPKEAHIVQAGNPTRLSGPLYRACTIARNIWVVIEITADPDDPDRTPRVAPEIAREQIAQYGRDNPWVLVNIFGQFPPSSIDSLIGPDEVMAAMKRYYRAHEIGNAPKVLGVDVALFGDDASVIAPRQGIQCFPFKKMRNVEPEFGAGVVARMEDEFGSASTFVDNSGGYGASWISWLRAMKRAPIGVQFAGQAHDPERFYNKRAEMAWDAVQWIKMGGALTENPELLSALTQTTYTYQKGRLLLEPKTDVKAKIGFSPDDFDAFILTFAEPVAVASAVRPVQKRVDEDYNVYAEPKAGYNPYSDKDRY